MLLCLIIRYPLFQSLTCLQTQSHPVSARYLLGLTLPMIRLDNTDDHLQVVSPIGLLVKVKFRGNSLPADFLTYDLIILQDFLILLVRLESFAPLYKATIEASTGTARPKSCKH